MSAQPFRDFGPVPWWAWDAKLEPEEMRRQIRQMKDMGIDEFFIYASMGLEYPNFLEESWFDCVAVAIDEAKKLDMHIWIYDDLNWPSGAAGGFLPKLYPQYQCRYLVRTKTMLQPNQKYSFNLGYGAECAFIRKHPWSPWEKVSFEDNVYINPYPHSVELWFFEAKWCHHTFLCSQGTMGSWNQGGICDFLNPDAVKAWISCLHQKYADHFPEECGKTLRGFFYDEPYFQPDPSGSLPWTEGIVEMFQSKYGYDFRDHLCEFYEETPGSEKTRFDFWSFFVERIGQAFSKTIADWCAEHNMQSTGHCVFEELCDQQTRLICCGEPHEVIRHNQIPGMDMLADPSPFAWHDNILFIGSLPSEPINILFTAKQACSTARYSGAKRVMCEACGILPPNMRIGHEKYTYSWLAACGVSMMNENSFQYSLRGYVKRSSGNKNFWQPWTKHYRGWADAIRELSKFGTGLLQAEVCVLCPESTIRACTAINDKRVPTAQGRVEPAMSATLDNLMRNHIDFEAMFEDILMASDVSDGIIHAPNSAFKVIVIPHAPVLRPEITAKLREFISNGGHVFFIDLATNRHPDGSIVDFSDVPMIDAAQLASKIGEIIQLPYSIETDGDVFTALRDCDGTMTLLLSNQSKRIDVNVRLKLNLPGPVAAKIVGENDEWQYDGGVIHLEDEQVVLLKIGKTAVRKSPTLEWGMLTGTPAEVGGPWKFTMDKPNNAMTSFELGFCPSEKEAKDVSKVPLWIPCTWDGMHDIDFCPEEYPNYWLKGKFSAEDASVLKDLSIIIERDELVSLFVNGKEIRNSVPYPLWTYECIKFDIESVAKTGINDLLILLKTSPLNARSKRALFALNNIEPVILHGNFTTKPGENIARLMPLPDKLDTGDVGAQGFQFFAGDTSYHCTYSAEKAPILEVPNPGDGTVQITCNGVNLGVKLWKPYRFDLTPAWKPNQENQITITLSGTIGNLCPRSFGNRKTDLRPVGLLAPVRFYPNSEERTSNYDASNPARKSQKVYYEAW